MELSGILRPFSKAINLAERIILLPFRPFIWFLDAVFWASDRTLKAIAEENRDPRVQREMEEWWREWWEEDILTSPEYSYIPGNIFCPDP